CGLGLCAVHDNLYAFGGWIGSEIGNTIEMFNPDVNRWQQHGKMPCSRFAMGLVKSGRIPSLVYVVGGANEFGIELNSAECYNPVTREWTDLPPMRVRRSFVNCAVMEGYLYAVGGWNEHDGTLSSVERYSIDEDAWEDVVDMGTSRAGASVAAVHGFVYVIGGRSVVEGYTFPTTVDTVECFDPHTRSWLDVPANLSGRCEAGVAVM
ncbi:PREDICTED: actin-binding protein IPP-like, partial [Priapulus caudatus]|uniref:Actin-binding protein IPP-like n=1 Tax=Priapulus caudatus TaxID=37621 RepID=A0ABM1F5Y9_PRICU